MNQALSSCIAVTQGRTDRLQIILSTCIYTWSSHFIESRSHGYSSINIQFKVQLRTVAKVEVRLETTPFASGLWGLVLRVVLLECN